MRDKVIPLLQEYFFEDWSRIHAVLGDGFIGQRDLPAPPGIDGEMKTSWFVLEPFASDAYDRLIGRVPTSAIDDEEDAEEENLA
jgi:5-methylcytosine-specific restriction protein B